MEKLGSNKTKTMNRTTRMETLTIPTEIWDHLFKNMDRKTKLLIRQICNNWRKTINSQTQGRNYLPAVKNTTQRIIQIPEGLIDEIKRGKFQDCQQIRHHNNHERSGYYLDLDKDDLLGGMEYIFQRISFVEEALKYLWLFPNPTTTKWRHTKNQPCHLISKTQNPLLKNEGITSLTTNRGTKTCDKTSKTSSQKYAANLKWKTRITDYWHPHIDRSNPKIETDQKLETKLQNPEKSRNPKQVKLKEEENSPNYPGNIGTKTADTK